MEINKYVDFFEYSNETKEKNIEDWSNFDFVLNKVKQDGIVLEFASERLKDNEEIVKEAVKQYGLALEYASEELQNNEEIVMEAVKQYG